MKFLVLFAALQLVSFSCIGLQQKRELSGNELFEEADSVAIIRLTGGDYEVGIGDAYDLRGEVLTVLKGELERTISYSDGYDYSEPCFKRSLGAFYIVYLKDRHTLWATASSFEVNGGPKFRFGDEESEDGISKLISKEYSKEAFFGNDHVWFSKDCAISESYNLLMDSALKIAFDKSIN